MNENSVLEESSFVNCRKIYSWAFMGRVSIPDRGDPELY